MEEPDFRRLVASARWGDDHAWRVLVEHWTPRLFAFLHSRCRDPELSEELVQDVFVKVAQRLADYDERGRFSSWIMLITINRLRDEMRRRSRHPRPVENETLGALAGSSIANLIPAFILKLLSGIVFLILGINLMTQSKKETSSDN